VHDAGNYVALWHNGCYTCVVCTVNLCDVYLYNVIAAVSTCA